MNEGAMELLRECRLLIIRLRNEARTGTGRDTISRIDALLAQSKAAPQDKPNPTTGQDGPAVPASAAPDSGEGMPEDLGDVLAYYDRIVSRLEDHPDGRETDFVITRDDYKIMRAALSLRERELEIQRQAKVDAQDQAWMLSGKLEAAEARAGEAEKERKEKT